MQKLGRAIGKRRITTVEQLQSLALGAVVRDDEKQQWRKDQPDHWVSTDASSQYTRSSMRLITANVDPLWVVSF